MAAIEIRKAKREGARLVIGISGLSGSGKTYTALQLAWGLANYDASKVGFLDTENRRGSLYADSLKDANGTVHEFWIGDLDAPFSPDRYIEAIKQFQDIGVEVLVIDSVTHEWEGLGGCHDIAAANGLRGAKNWLVGKEHHKRFMNIMLQSNMHIIACIRARQKVEVVEQIVDGKKQKVFNPLGVLPVQEENFMYEMTASMMMWNAGREQQVLKCPDELKGILGREKGYITAADGKALRDWVDGAKQLDPKVEEYRNRLRMNTEQGVAHITTCWNKTPANIRKALGDAFFETLKAAAAEFDAQKRAASEGGAAVAELNEQVLGNGAQAAE